jgi:putative transposase
VRRLLSDVVTELHVASRSTYGVRRLRAALWHERGLVVNKKLIRRIMNEQGLVGLPRPKKGHRNLVNVATHEDLVQRNFAATSPNSLWLSDITEHKTTCIPVVVATLRFVATLIEHRDVPQESPSQVLFSVAY